MAFGTGFHVLSAAPIPTFPPPAQGEAPVGRMGAWIIRTFSAGSRVRRQYVTARSLTGIHALATRFTSCEAHQPGLAAGAANTWTHCSRRGERDILPSHSVLLPMILLEKALIRLQEYTLSNPLRIPFDDGISPRISVRRASSLPEEQTVGASQDVLIVIRCRWDQAQRMRMSENLLRQ